jgi:hypothetical protein
MLVPAGVLRLPLLSPREGGCTMADAGRDDRAERRAPGGDRPDRADYERQLEGSSASELMADEMLANAMAHGDEVDLDRLHEESLAAAAEIDESDATRRRKRKRAE